MEGIRFFNCVRPEVSPREETGDPERKALGSGFVWSELVRAFFCWRGSVLWWVGVTAGCGGAGVFVVSGVAGKTSSPLIFVGHGGVCL